MNNNKRIKLEDSKNVIFHNPNEATSSSNSTTIEQQIQSPKLTYFNGSKSFQMPLYHPSMFTPNLILPAPELNFQPLPFASLYSPAAMGISFGQSWPPYPPTTLEVTPALVSKNLTPTVNKIEHKPSIKSSSKTNENHNLVKNTNVSASCNSSSENERRIAVNNHNSHHIQKSNRSKDERRLFQNNDINNKHNSDNMDAYMNRSKIQDIMELIYNKKIEFKRSTPLEPYYKQLPFITANNQIIQIIEGTQQLIDLREKFKYEILERAERLRSQKPAFSFPKRKVKLKAHKHHHDECGFSCESDESDFDDSDSDDSDDNENSSVKELERKKSHPWRLHQELWYNEPGEMNDGLLCRCSLKAQRSGIRHGIYLGEEHLPRCDPNTNNRHRLYHYVISIYPRTNFLVDTPTTIDHDGHTYYFEGYSLFSHFSIPSSFPSCKIIRYNIGYEITFTEDDFPQNFCVGDLDPVFNYIFYELLELVDLNLKAKNDDEGCNRFHFMPRFVRLLENDGKEILSMSLVLEYLYRKSKPLIEEDRLEHYIRMENHEWNDFAKQHKGFLVTCPSMKPCSLRIDQIDREKDDLVTENDKNSSPSQELPSDDKFPVIVHFGIRPPQLSYAGNPKYQKAWRSYVKYRHLLANKEKVTYQDKQILIQKEEKLQEMRSKSDLKRDVTVVVSSKGFYCTGLQCDIVQHSLIIPVLVSHLRFHCSLQHLEKIIGYTFKDRSLLQLSLTHPSYRENFGTNPDHARNTLTNCGLRYLEYGDRKVHFMNTRKRGINMLINIMSRFGCNEETVSNINHNERLEFLGDAVVEFLTSIHLYFLFPDLEEGGLATYRAALVQNQHLAVLARKLQLEKFMLYAHGSDLCHDLELRHAMANCFEAFMGALFLDGGIDIADKVFSCTLFDGDDEESKLLHEIWVKYPAHPLQTQEPDGDRHFIPTVPRLKELAKFEEMTGIEFKHIRLLARAFTHRSVGYNNLTLGSNQRMEFLGDTVLQLIASEYLYKYFPDHHEGHLSLLRSSLVNNKTQSVVCDDLGIIDMTQYNSVKSELKTKDRADLLEAFIGALYVDKGIEYCRIFCEVCFFPRLEQFIMNQDWNDPKSKLQQCCLTLRSADCGEPDIPTYKVIDSKGPTNTRIYEVAVYFRDDRLATGKGHSIQEAEMNAATNALRLSKELFPHLVLQKRVIQRNIKSCKDKDKMEENHLD